MMFVTGWSSLVSNLRSRLVTIPTTRPAALITGRPEIRCWRVRASTSRTFMLRTDGDGIFDDAAFEALDLGYFGGLRLGRHVLVNDADTAFLRDRDREPRLGHGIHRGRDDGEC